MKLDEPPQGLDEKGLSRHNRLQKLLISLTPYTLTDETIGYINQQLNQLSYQPATYSNEAARCFQKIVNRLSFKEKLVLPKHYVSLWLGVGIGAFGVPIGVAFASAIENMALIGAGLPIGMAIGAALGAGLDNKAKSEGRVLNID